MILLCAVYFDWDFRRGAVHFDWMKVGLIEAINERLMFGLYRVGVLSYLYDEMYEKSFR